MRFHAVMIDETGCEFGVSVVAKSRQAAYDKLKENYPECRSCVQLESPADTRRREKAISDQVNRIYWGEEQEDERDW